MPPSKIPVPDQLKLEERFSFIEDETLRTNTVITFRYIIFLIGLETQEELPGPITYSLYKDLIVHTATVIEACIHYALKTLIEKNKIKSSDVTETEWKEEKCKIIEEFDDGNRQVCGVVRHKTTINLTKHTNFIDLNRACLRAKIFTQDVFEKAENLRESRHRIHLAGLSNVDDLYKKTHVDKHFNYAQIVLQCLEDKLKEI